jgi:DNA-binding transcriptional ArsR family regulator
MDRYQSKNEARSKNESDEQPKKAKPNGAGATIGDAPPLTPEQVDISEALSAFSTDAAQLGLSRWEQIGAAVFCATDGSDEGFKLFDEWSKGWVFYKAEDTVRRWETCAKLPPSDMTPETLFELAAKVRERNRALEEATRLDDLSYSEQKDALKKKAGLKGDVLDKERKKRRKRVEPPPKPKPKPIDELAKEAKDLIAAEQVLDLFVEDISARLAGADKGSAELLYLACTSRLFEKPMSVVNKGESAAGKSYERDCVFAYIPDEDIFHLTTMSDQAIIYLPDDLAHKILSIAEAAGTQDRDAQEYVLREIISAGRITRLVAIKGGPGEAPMTQAVVKEGPIMFITGTTRARLHPEIETRILSIEADDTSRQTRRVVEKIAEIEGGLAEVDKVDPKWIAFQRWLAAGERRVAIPFARALARHAHLYVNSVRMRRDFRQVLTTVKAHALLHREHRKRDAQGRIVATAYDYEVAYDLLAARLAQGAGLTLKRNDERVLDKLRDLSEESERGVTVAELVRALDLNQTTVNRRLMKLVTNGFVENLNPGIGKTGRFRIIAEPSAGAVLPKPDDLFDPPHDKEGESAA